MAITIIRGDTHHLWAQLQNGTAGFDFRQQSPLTNLGTGGSALNLSASGSPTHTAGAGYTFDGTDDTMLDPDNDLLDVGAGEALTVFFAGSVDSLAALRTVVSKRATTSTAAASAAGWAMHVMTTGAVNLRFSIGSGSVVNMNSGTGIVAGQRFVGAVRIGTATCQAYLNGVGGASTARPAGSGANAVQVAVMSLNNTAGTFCAGTARQLLAVRADMTDAEIAYVSALMAAA